MKKLIIFCITTLLINCSYEGKDIEKFNQSKYPECLNSSIDMILKNSSKNPRSNIEKYLYNGQNVYVVNDCPMCPDSQSYVSNEKCENICRINGIDGKNTCINWDKAVFIETVWIDPM